MKKHFIFLYILWWAYLPGIQAQVTDQGNFMIGTKIGLSAAQSKVSFNNGDGGKQEESPTSTQFNIAPTIGYFVFDDLALGIGLDYTFNKVEEDNLENVKDSDLLFGPFARYYVPVADDMSFFLEANFGFGTSSDNQVIAGAPQSINTNILAFGVGPGFTIFSSRSVGIEAILRYNYAKSVFDTEIAGIKRETTTKTNQFDFALGVQFYFSSITKAKAEDIGF